MSNMTKAELEAELRQAQDKICYCECKNKELQERLSAIVVPAQCDTYVEAVRAYGKQSQLVMAMEEMSELTKELSKNLRGADNSKALAEEIADVEIMLEQLKVISATALWWTASVRESWSACLTGSREKRGNERCGATQGGNTFPGDGGVILRTGVPDYEL